MQDNMKNPEKNDPGYPLFGMPPVLGAALS